MQGRSAVSIARFRTEPARKRDGFAQSTSALSEALHNLDLQVVVGVAAIGLLLTAMLACALPISDVLNLIAQPD
jgi:adenine/guanine phosphoribosyltransferase-like PRPP-binding protein